MNEYEMETTRRRQDLFYAVAHCQPMKLIYALQEAYKRAVDREHQMRVVMTQERLDKIRILEGRVEE